MVEDLVYKTSALNGAETLKSKHPTGAVYMFLCHAGDYDPTSGMYLMVPPSATVSASEQKRVSNLFDKKYSTLRYYATICPNVPVYGVKDTSVDYDETCGYIGTDGKCRTLILPSCGDFSIDTFRFNPGVFVKEYFNSSQNKCSTTISIGRDIKNTGFCS